MLCRTCQYPLWNLTARQCPECGALGSIEEVDGEMRCVDCDLVVGAKTKLPGFGRR